MGLEAPSNSPVRGEEGREAEEKRRNTAAGRTKKSGMVSRTMDETCPVMGDGGWVTGYGCEKTSTCLRYEFDKSSIRVR